MAIMDLLIASKPMI